MPLWGRQRRVDSLERPVREPLADLGVGDRTDVLPAEHAVPRRRDEFVARVGEAARQVPEGGQPGPRPVEVPEDAEHLNFDYRYGAEENSNYLDSEFQDFFTATLRPRSIP